MLNNINKKRIVVITLLLVLILLVLFVPFEKIMNLPSILGAVVSIAKVFVTGLETSQQCDIELIEGWNLVGIVCEPEDTNVSSVLSAITDNYTSIHSYSASEYPDKWKSYNPSMPAWVVQDISTINVKSGYWIRMSNNDTLIVDGSITTPNFISLVEGWNLISYPANSSDSPENAFATLDGSYSIVWMYNASSSSYLYYNPDLGSGTFSEVDTIHGYWINMTRGDTLWTT